MINQVTAACHFAVGRSRTRRERRTPRTRRDRGAPRAGGQYLATAAPCREQPPGHHRTVYLIETWRTRVVGDGEVRDQRLGRAEVEQDRGSSTAGAEVEQDRGSSASSSGWSRSRERVRRRQYRRARGRPRGTAAALRREARRRTARAAAVHRAGRKPARELSLAGHLAECRVSRGRRQARGRSRRLRERAAATAACTPTGEAAEILARVCALRSALQSTGLCVGRKHRHHSAGRCGGGRSARHRGRHAGTLEGAERRQR